jgi:hypothetical protein
MFALIFCPCDHHSFTAGNFFGAPLLLLVVGYSCATIYKDTLNLGNTESGLEVYPCVHFQSEVSELWSFDLATYQWVFLNTSKWQPAGAGAGAASPPAREQHSAAVIDRDVYIFGGKTRIFAKSAATGDTLFEHHGDLVFGDLWRLAVERPKQYTLTYPADFAVRSPIHSPDIGAGADVFPISQVGRTLAPIYGALNDTMEATSDGVTPREGLCIDKAVVRVSQLCCCDDKWFGC